MAVSVVQATDIVIKCYVIDISEFLPELQVLHGQFFVDQWRRATKLPSHLYCSAAFTVHES